LNSASKSKTSASEVITKARMSTTVTAKGQVTIPKAVRDMLGIGPGSQVDFRRPASKSAGLPSFAGIPERA
jgi:AbrB family looped-hinge helix DNA binding protein